MQRIHNEFSDVLFYQELCVLKAHLSNHTKHLPGGGICTPGTTNGEGVPTTTTANNSIPGVDKMSE